MASSGKLDDRHIRVFISSTFRDMKDERGCLVEFNFLQRRRLGKSLGAIQSTEMEI